MEVGRQIKLACCQHVVIPPDNFKKAEQVGESMHLLKQPYKFNRIITLD